MVVCYWKTWDDIFKEEDIDAALCSHLIYSYTSIDTNKDEISPPGWIHFDFKEKAYRCFLRYKYPELKVIIIDRLLSLSNDASHSSFERKKLSNNFTWDFEHIFDIRDPFGLCPGQNFVYSSLVFFENPD